jgi:N-carbamoylputrescine amidase
LRVGLVQFRAARTVKESARPGLQPVEHQRRLAALAWLAERAAQDSDLVVLPEMAATGYVFPDRDAVAAVAEAPDGATFHSWSRIAREHRCWLVGGFPERDGDRLFNSALVLDPTGERAFVYRKTLLYDADRPWASPGDSGYRAFDTDSGRFGVGICMDLNDDAFLGWAKDASLDAIAFPTNWVDEGTLEIPTWTYWAWRMRGLPGALLAANTWGSDGGFTFTGKSVILQNSRALAALPVSGNGVVRGTIALQPVADPAGP